MEITTEKVKAENLQDLIRSRIESLRPKLLDLSRRNPLISTRLSPRSSSLVRIVDELPDVLAYHLRNQQPMRFFSLPPLGEDPKDEQSKQFQDALSDARFTDEAYLNALEQLDSKDEQNIADVQEIERDLKDRLRVDLDMAARQKKTELSLPQHAINNGITPYYDLPYPADEHEDGRHSDENIQTLLLPEDMERKLNALMTKCRTWEQETGINVLQAAFGFLEWAEPNSSDSAFAPLILLPVRLEKRKTREGTEFWVNADGDDTETNFVIAEKMRLDFGIVLPRFQQSDSLEAYFQEVAEAAPKTMRWKVRRQVAFGIFPSARMAMYNDLSTNNHSFEKSTVISNLFGGTGSYGTTPFADEYDVDHPDIECKAPCLVLDADSSQFSTIVDILDGKNLAVEGPPGTGKSQTIVNTIAVAMAQGKKVLFVAEKMAALEVVKSRLEAVGLGEFLLPLQAKRSTREQVIESIRNRLEMDSPPAPRDYEIKIEKFRHIRAELAAYIETISMSFGKTGLNIYDILGKSIVTSDVMSGVPRAMQTPKITDIESYDRLKREAVQEAGDDLEKAWQESSRSAPYWRGLMVQNLDRFVASTLIQLAQDASLAFEKLLQDRQHLDIFAIGVNDTVEELSCLQQSLNDLLQLTPMPDSALIGRICRSSNINTIKEFLQACLRYQSEHAVFAQTVTNPDDSETPRVLREVGVLCAESGLTTLDQRVWQADIIWLEKTIESKKCIWANLKDFINFFPAAASVSIDTLRQAAELVSGVDKETIVNRSERTADPTVAALVTRLCQTGRKLREEGGSLADVVSTSTTLSVSDLLIHAECIKNSGMFSWLFTSFRGAKRAYMAHTKRPAFKKNDAVEDLHGLAKWKQAEQSFAEDPQAHSFFGIHFRGIETDFNLFERLTDFYQVVDMTFPGLANRELRTLLKSGDTEFLLSIPHIPQDGCSGTFLELETEIKELDSTLATRKKFIHKLEVLLPILFHPASIEISSLPELAERFEKLAGLKQALDSSTIAQSILQNKFCGCSTKPEQFATDLEALSVLEGQRKYLSLLLNLLDTSRLQDAVLAIEAVIRGGDTATICLAALENKSGIFFSEHLNGSGYKEMAKFFGDASRDEEGIFIHSAFAKARAKINDLGFTWAATALEENNLPFTQLGIILEAIIFRAMVMSVYETYGSILSRYPGAKEALIKKHPELCLHFSD